VISDAQEKTYVLVFDKGDEVVSGLRRFASDEGIRAAQLTAIGAFSDVTLGFFERERNDYKRIPVDEQVELLALIGDIALKDDEPELHAHVVIGKADGTAHGGHLLEAHVWPTLEVMLTEAPVALHRRFDEETQLPLLTADA
jgi:hypothetical protein